VILTHLVIFGFLSGAGGEVATAPSPTPPEVFYGGGNSYAPQGYRSQHDEALLVADEQDAEDIAFVLATFIRGLH
jgi:hypothetical protein